jgi:S-adenosylmethionine synthetase
VSLQDIYNSVYKTFTFDLASIVRQLQLDRPIYSNLSVFGHFGRDELKLP